MGLLEAAVSEAHPALAEGHQRVGIPELVYLMAEVSAVGDR